MKELTKEQYQAEVLREYANIIAQGDVKPGAGAREVAEKRVKERLSAQTGTQQANATTESEELKGKLWFTPPEVRKILFIGMLVGGCLALVFTIIVLLIAVIR